MCGAGRGDIELTHNMTAMTIKGSKLKQLKELDVGIPCEDKCMN